MSERKNIDKLFQEKLQDFEVSPSEEIWSTIEAKLNEKKKRRVIPFWWNFAGVAAALLIGFLIGKSFVGTEIKPNNNPVVIDNNSGQQQTNQSNSTETESKNIIPNHYKKDIVTNTTKSDKPENKIINLDRNNSKINNHLSQNAITETQITIPHSLKNKSDSKKLKTHLSTSMAERINQIALVNRNKNSNEIKQDNIAQTENKTSDSNTINTGTNNKTINLDALKGGADSNSKIVTTEKKVTDSVKNKPVATNALEELLKEKESKTTQQSKENRWQITSSVAPVFLGSVAKGSSIDPMFNNNSKSYNTSLSLGVGVSYALNPKITVRTGVNKMSVDYNTNGIVFFADLNNSGIATIDPSTSGKAIRVEDETVETSGLLPFENAFVHKNEGYINQKIGYYEIPFEVTYALIDKRFGIKIIGGMSTLFLNENKISVVSQEITTDLGKANNLNDVHFSTNLGLGLKYGFLKSLEFTVEPTFKYQLNTFSSNAVDFKPYVFGIYSGISYKF